MPKLFFILLLILTTLSCKKSTGPNEDPPTGEIDLQQACSPGVTDCYLKLTITEAEFPMGYIILRDSVEIMSGTVHRADTIVIDTTLLPAATYRYFAYLTVKQQIIDTSATITLTTMDTTSHNFTWEVMSFGTGGGSELNDVAIIDENNIWAVGEIHTDDTDQPDSLGNWIPPYNAVHWNGEEWELLRFLKENGNIITPIRDIYYENDNLIWIAAGSIYKWNGNFATLEYLRDTETMELAEHFCYMSEENIYCVGNAGLIVHYNGQTWRKAYSGTELPIQDIWGATDPETGEEVVLCVASRRDQNNGSKILKVHGTLVQEINSEGLSWKLSSLWFIPHKLYYVGGSGLYFQRTLGSSWKKDISYPPYYKFSIRGIDLNDIVIVGSYGSISHFNGYTWKYFVENESPEYNGEFSAVDIKNNIIVTVGIEFGSNRDILVLGNRN